MSGENRKRLTIAVGGIAAGILLTIVPRFEGTELKAAPDPIGIVSACNGHTGDDVVLGQRYTPDQCEQLLVDDLITHNRAVDRCVHVPLQPYQRAAFVSFAFNVGGMRFCASTLVRKLNAGDYAGACAELSQWTRAAGRELPGLVARRAEERALCEGNVKAAR
jgi:lysozyme